MLRRVLFAALVLGVSSIAVGDIIIPIPPEPWPPGCIGPGQRVVITERTWFGNGQHIHVCGGILECTAPRLDMDDATITITSGNIDFITDYKVCDSEGPSVLEVLGGVFEMQDVENRMATRGGHILMGAGVLRLKNWVPGDPLRDMVMWLEDGLFQTAPGFEGCSALIEVAADGYQQAFIPEPATMMLLGLGGLLVCRRRR